MNSFVKFTQTDWDEEIWRYDLEKWLKIYLDKESITPKEFEKWDDHLINGNPTAKELQSFYDCTGWIRKRHSR